jgi:hypothetical protein
MPTRSRAAIALAAWTLLVWTFRTGTIWAGDGTTAARLGRTALVAAFTALAIATLWLARRRSPRLAPVVRGFAAWTVGVWVVRAAGIAVGDHGAGFVAVHLVLAGVSIGLAAAAALETRVGERAPARR